MRLGIFLHSLREMLNADLKPAHPMPSAHLAIELVLHFFVHCLHCLLCPVCDLCSQDCWVIKLPHCFACSGDLDNIG